MKLNYHTMTIKCGALTPLSPAKPEPATIKLEAGKRYVLRNGDITEPLAYNNGSKDYPFYAATQREKRLTWAAAGSYTDSGMDCEFDIVSECVEPEPFKLEVGCWYLRRDGEIVGPLTRNGSNSRLYGYAVGTFSYKSNGSWCTIPHPNDLIEKVDPPAVLVRESLLDAEKRDHEATTAAYKQVVKMNGALAEKNAELLARLTQLKDDHAKRCSAYDTLNSEHGAMIAKCATLRDDNIALTGKLETARLAFASMRGLAIRAYDQTIR